MDTITKALLALIAIGLLGLNAQLMVRPATGQTSWLTPGPTVGDFVALDAIEDLAERVRASERLSLTVPVVQVRGAVALR